MRIFMIASGITGDVVESGRAGQIAVQVCNFAFGRLLDPVNGLPAGVVMPKLILIQKFVDSSSPLLAALAATGKGPADPLRIAFTSTQAGSTTELEVVTVDLAGTRIEQFDTELRPSGGDAVESLALAYTKLSAKVTTRDSRQVVIDVKTYEFAPPP